MYPLIPFAAGVIAGALGIRLLRTVKTPDLGSAAQSAKEQLDRAETGLRQAAASGLSAVERSSAHLRSKIAPAATAAEPATKTRKPAPKAAKPEPTPPATETAASALMAGEAAFQKPAAKRRKPSAGKAKARKSTPPTEQTS